MLINIYHDTIPQIWKKRNDVFPTSICPKIRVILDKFDEVSDKYVNVRTYALVRSYCMRPFAWRTLFTAPLLDGHLV
ncbi:hypothetical protein NECAME_00100 [Necator americanus]|uniref:Uncharacterized protein n=1 Tax=Necator americanus TaxID=51031 RepID=W2U1J3_NECAM|nr:hypothetical protein NECAME_00100 [Necator americanus]ETN87241.1 hypothetical protein NECAME_00100 [Necator americanus]